MAVPSVVSGNQTNNPTDATFHAWRPLDSVSRQQEGAPKSVVPLQRGRCHGRNFREKPGEHPLSRPGTPRASQSCASILFHFIYV